MDAPAATAAMDGGLGSVSVLPIKPLPCDIVVKVIGYKPSARDISRPLFMHIVYKIMLNL